MTDRYTAPDNASVFNLKRAHNGLAHDLVDQRFRNRILNPGMRETRGQSVFAWQANLNLDAPAALDTLVGTVTYDFAPGQWIRQAVISPILDTTYTVVSNIADTTGIITVQLEGGTEDIFGEDGTENPSTEIEGGGLFTLRGKTRTSPADSTTRYNDTIYLKYINNTASTVSVTFKFTSIVIGSIAITGHHDFAQFVRFNDATDKGYWEVTLDDRQTWHRLWNDGTDFVNSVGFIVQEQTVDLVHQDNIVAGPGIQIDYGFLPDGTTPTVIVSGTGSGSGGSGDWTREDVTYQSLLEHSDFDFVTYDTLLESGTTSGTASYTGVIDDYGAGSLSGGLNDDIITQDLVAEMGDGTAHYAFYFHAVWSGVGYNLYYSTSADGTNWGGWVACPAEETVAVPGGFTHLRFRLVYTGNTTVYSFGVLYSQSVYGAGTAIGFLERYTVGAGGEPINTIIEVPNSKWYHKDGKSLAVYYNRARLILGIDYEEESAGFVDKSNLVKFTFPLEEDAEIIFQEYYGYVDISAENGIRLDTDHYPTGHHKNDLGVYYISAAGNNANDGLSWDTAWQTLDFALNRLDGIGGTKIWLADDQSFEVVDPHFLNSTSLTITRSGLGTSRPVISFVSTYDGVDNKWGGLYMNNGSLEMLSVDIIIEDPDQPFQADNLNRRGIPFRNGLNSGIVNFDNCDIEVRGAPIYEGGTDGQVTDINFQGCTITGNRTVRSYPLIDFNNTLGGLYVNNTTLAGDASSWKDEVEGIIRSGGSVANIRTNLPELYGVVDEITGIQYEIKVINGQIALVQI